MKVIGVIPARYASVRLEGKVLATLLGKPVIQHVWERVKKSKLLDDLIIACDDARIEKAAKKFQAKVVLTSKEHASGSDRITEVVNPLDVDVVVNIQGDEPTIHHTMVDHLARALMDDQAASMATLIKKMDDPDEIGDPNVVKVVIDRHRYALYFSRSPIPFNRGKQKLKDLIYYKHFGLYAYRKEFLLTFKGLPKSRLENVEKLEQLRVLEAGYRIKTVETNRDTVGVDTKGDLRRAESFLKKENLNRE